MKRGNNWSRAISARLLGEHGSSSRIQTAYALAKHVPRSIPLLVDALGHSNMKVRQAATAGLGKTRSPKAVEPLLLCWSSLDPWLRKRATEALASIGPPAVIPLAKMLDHNDPYLRWKAVWVLGMINDDRTCRLIADMLRDPCKEVRWMAAKALGRKESDRAVPDLVELLEDHDPGIREIATESLFQITGQKFDPGVRR